MADGSSKQQRLMRERARALATILLTSREDVAVQDVTQDIGIDLLARVHSSDKTGLRQFGIELRYVWGAVDAAHADKVLSPTLRSHQRYGPFPFPVVMFFYTMENDQGWYSWAVEPVVSKDGAAILSPADTASCLPLDQKALDRIVDRVNRWYDAFFNTVSPPEPVGSIPKRP